MWEKPHPEPVEGEAFFFMLRDDRLKSGLLSMRIFFVLSETHVCLVLRNRYGKTNAPGGVRNPMPGRMHPSERKTDQQTKWWSFDNVR